MAPTFKLTSNTVNNNQLQNFSTAMPAPPTNITDALQYEHQEHHNHSHSLPDCISQGGTIAEWQPNTYNQNTHVRVHMPDGSDKFFPNVKQEHLQLYLTSKTVTGDTQESYYDSSVTFSRDGSPVEEEDDDDDDDDSDDEMAIASSDRPTNQPLFLNFTSDLAPQHMPKKKSKEKKQLQYRVNGVNILNRNSLDMQTAMERLKRRRENHNNVERKRRNNINNTIYEISLLMPVAYRPGSKPNKGSILRRAVDYIKDLQNENETMRAKLNSFKGGMQPTQSASGQVEFVSVKNSAPTTSGTSLPSLATSTATTPRGLAPLLTAGNQNSLEPTSPLTLPLPSTFRNARLKVDRLPSASGLSNPNSPPIMTGGRSLSETIVLPPITAELAKEFALPPPRASSPLHKAPYLVPQPPPTTSHASGATPPFMFTPASTLSMMQNSLSPLSSSSSSSSPSSHTCIPSSSNQYFV